MRELLPEAEYSEFCDDVLLSQEVGEQEFSEVMNSAIVKVAPNISTSEDAELIEALKKLCL